MNTEETIQFLKDQERDIMGWKKEVDRLQNTVNDLMEYKNKNKMTRRQADDLLRDFRMECLEFGKYPDYVITEFLDSKFKK